MNLPFDFHRLEPRMWIEAHYDDAEMERESHT